MEMHPTTPHTLYTLKYMLKSCTRHDFSVIKIKHSIASGGLCPPDPLLQRSISIFSPLPHKILDPPLALACLSVYSIVYKRYNYNK